MQDKNSNNQLQPKLGRGAGPKQNQEMPKSANACIVFWDGISKGTANMISMANSS